MRYTVVIRTLTGGDKYKYLLQSIKKQTIQPDHVYVVQPYGYEPPTQRLGYEEYIHTNKGMWNQRIYGMIYCHEQKNHSDFLLICDDDISFDSDFVETLMQYSQEYKADLMIPLPNIKWNMIKQIKGVFLGMNSINSSSPFRVSIKSNGSSTRNDSLTTNVNPTQSGNFQCFLMRTDIVSKMNLKDELWLDHTRYAWPDDQVFFYKAFLQNMGVYSCRYPCHIHLDERTGVTGRQRERDFAYAMGRNGYIFWNKFIKSNRNNINRLLCQISFDHRLIFTGIYYTIRGIYKCNLSLPFLYLKGYLSGKKFASHQNNN